MDFHDKVGGVDGLDIPKFACHRFSIDPCRESSKFGYQLAVQKTTEMKLNTFFFIIIKLKNKIKTKQKCTYISFIKSS